MKSSDLWAWLILLAIPEKPLELEGMWRSCEKMGNEADLEYVAEFKEDKLVENFYGTLPDDGNCNGERVFHYRRSFRLSTNNFNFKVDYSKDGTLFMRQEGFDIHKLSVVHDFDYKNYFSYQIRGETLEIRSKGSKSYLKRVHYPNLLKMKEFLLGISYGKKHQEINNPSTTSIGNP